MIEESKILTQEDADKAAERAIKNIHGKPRTPQIYRLCWQVMKGRIARGSGLRTKGGLLRDMEEIEKMVRG